MRGAAGLRRKGEVDEGMRTPAAEEEGRGLAAAAALKRRRSGGRPD